MLVDSGEIIGNVIRIYIYLLSFSTYRNCLRMTSLYRCVSRSKRNRRDYMFNQDKYKIKDDPHGELVLLERLIPYTGR